MTDLITIIIPAFNVEKYLANCLKSIVSQTHENIEVIIINDGSKDNTGKIAEEYAINDNRIQVFHQENQGVSAARNYGLEIAKGNFIGFVDGDDYIEKDMYEFLLNNLIKYEADISHCAFALVKPEKTISFHGTGTVLVQTKYEAIRELLSGHRIEPSSCTKLFKKEILKNLRFATDIKINEDLLFNIQAFKNAEKIVFKDVVKYKYQYNPGSASRSSDALLIASHVFETATRIKKILREPEIKQSAEKFYVTKLVTSLKSLKKNKLFNTEIARQQRNELKSSTTKNLGLRVSVLKNLLVNFPFFYNSFIYFYDLLFAKNQKWKND